MKINQWFVQERGVMGPHQTQAFALDKQHSSLVESYEEIA